MAQTPCHATLGSSLPKVAPRKKTSEGRELPYTFPSLVFLAPLPPKDPGSGEFGLAIQRLVEVYLFDRGAEWPCVTNDVDQI